MRRQKSKAKTAPSAVKRPAPKRARAKVEGTSPESLAFLQAHGIAVSPEGMERMVAAAVESLPRTLYPMDPTHDLTEAERGALVRGGFDVTPRNLGFKDPLAGTAADYAALLRTSKTVAETAKILGVNQSRVRQRLNSVPPTLYGFKLDGEWRVPDFLFEGGALVPGAAEIASRLDSEIHPVAFFRWFTTPDPDLVMDGDDAEPVSPRLWLLSGHDAAVAAELAAEL
ncbi:MAG: hypothetical protein ACAI25_05805 [Planctomycetota bacterium]